MFIVIIDALREEWNKCTTLGRWVWFPLFTVFIMSGMLVFTLFVPLFLFIFWLSGPTAVLAKWVDRLLFRDPSNTEDQRACSAPMNPIVGQDPDTDLIATVNTICDRKETAPNGPAPVNELAGRTDQGNGHA